MPSAGVWVLGATVLGATVLGASVLGATVLRASVLGASVLGASVLGASVLGATVQDRRELDLLRRWARIFDSAFRIPGTNIRFGIDPIIGLLPGVGDLASPVLSLFMIWQGARMGVPKIVLTRMMFNALIDGLSGVVPVVGDLFDFGWKATEWNLALLERHAMPGQRATSFDYVFVILCCTVIVIVAVLPVLLIWWGLNSLEQLLRR